MYKRKLNKTAKEKTAVRREKNIFNLTPKQWTTLKEMAEDLKYTYEGEPEEVTEIIPLLRHIKNKTLTVDDIDTLTQVLDDYIDSEMQEGNHSDAVFYERLEDKLLDIRGKIRKSKHKK